MIEPIYIKADINLQVQRQLDDLFAEIDQASETSDYIDEEKLEGYVEK